MNLCVSVCVYVTVSWQESIQGMVQHRQTGESQLASAQGSMMVM